MGIVELETPIINKQEEPIISSKQLDKICKRLDGLINKIELIDKDIQILNNLIALIEVKNNIFNAIKKLDEYDEKLEEKREELKNKINPLIHKLRIKINIELNFEELPKHFEDIIQNLTEEKKLINEELEEEYRKEEEAFIDEKYTRIIQLRSELKDTSELEETRYIRSKMATQIETTKELVKNI